MYLSFCLLDALGDEVLELAGVPLRGKSALFVDNLMSTIQSEFEIIVRHQLISSFQPIEPNVSRRHSVDTTDIPATNNTVIKSKSTSISSLKQTDPVEEDEPPSFIPADIFPKPSIDPPSNISPPPPCSNLLPSHPGIPIRRQNSNESGESDSLSQYFHTSSNLGEPSNSHGRSQSVIPIGCSMNNPANRLQNFLKADSKHSSRASTSVERKSSLAALSFKFLKKKTKSVDFSHDKHAIHQRFHPTDYVGDIELQIGHDSDREQLAIRIIRAKNLLPKDTNGYSDPFAKVYLLPGRE